MASAHQALQYLLYPGKRVGILLCVSIQVAKVNTKMQAAILFHTNTIALHHVLWLGLMVPDSYISFKWFLASSTSGSRIRLNHSLKWVSSVTFIICSVEWVQPNSAGSNENTSWYSARSQLAASTSSGVHESRPLKSNSSNNFPCLCLTVSLGVWESWYLSAPSHSCSPLGGSGTSNAASHPGHWGFLMEGLQVCSIVPYHYNCFHNAFP